MKYTKTVQTTFNLFAFLVLAVLAAGCAGTNDLLDRENAAMGAGFKVITPTKPEQLASLQKLPPDKVTEITFGGKPYYILPDPANHRAYVGGPKQYQLYKHYRQEQKANLEGYEATPDQVQVVEGNAMDWSAWSGWGPLTSDGFLGEPGWY